MLAVVVAVVVVVVMMKVVCVCVCVCPGGGGVQQFLLCEPRLNEICDDFCEELVPVHCSVQQRVPQRPLRPLPRTQALPRVKHLRTNHTKTIDHEKVRSVCVVVCASPCTACVQLDVSIQT
jgi:hypothetical protein